MCLRSLHVILLRARVAMLYIFKYNNYSFNTYFLNNSSVVEIGSISYYSHTVQYIILHAWASTSARGGNLVLFTKPFCNHMKGWNFPHEQREVIILNYVQHSRHRSDWTVGDEQIEGVVCKNKKKQNSPNSGEASPTSLLHSNVWDAPCQQRCLALLIISASQNQNRLE